MSNQSFGLLTTIIPLKKIIRLICDFECTSVTGCKVALVVSLLQGQLKSWKKCYFTFATQVDLTLLKIP